MLAHDFLSVPITFFGQPLPGDTLQASLMALIRRTIPTNGTLASRFALGIALALLDTNSDAAEGTVAAENQLVEVDVRGRRSTMRVVKPPFVKPSVR